MAIIRVPKVNNYTVMSNHHLLNPALSLKAKGLMSYMLSRPDSWDFTIEGLSRLNKDGVDVAGAANTMTSWLPTGQGHSGYNSVNTRISKYEDQSLLPDAQWEKRIIFPEA